MMMLRRFLVLLALLVAAPSAYAQDATLAKQVEIIRTAYGVPHIRAQNFKAAGYALGYAQVEDYGDIVPIMLLRARGELARVFGQDSIDSDFRNRPNWLDATRGYALLSHETRDMYDGFAAGVNAYIRLHRAEFRPGIEPRFTGIDALTTDMELPDRRSLERLLRRLPEAPASERGSNAWALAPSRTRSGKAILLRNPHLDWDAGYYEAHLTIPGVVDFYGDFRIGGPFQTIGGFNARLGWSTTNNAVDGDEVYALTVDPARPDHVLFDGASIPLRRETMTIAYKNGDRLAEESRELLSTSIGPVVGRSKDQVFVWKYAGGGDWRLGEMWLRMMRARDLAEWKQALRMLAKPSSNFTYADADGNIFYVWYGQLPARPHVSGGDTAVIAATSSRQVWTHLMPFDSLPQVQNPKGGYVHNENDTFHYTNLNEIISTGAFPALPPPRLGLRTQLALELISGKDKLSLEDVVRLKHTTRMLLADRVKPDLLAALKTADASAEVVAAAELLARWDNTVAPESRGSVLFDLWWTRYGEVRPDVRGAEREALLYRRPWTAEDPIHTPEGLRSPERAVTAFVWAVREAKQRFGSWDVTWGEVHRARRGAVDVAAGGCPGGLGCFRVFWFSEAPDGKRVVSGGDGWVLAVEFGAVPRAYSVLAYGESAKPASKHHADQLAMFARGELKLVAFTQRAVDQQAVRRYHPGLENSEAAN
jgi:acyl-homoserine-lactone acylase